MTLEAACKKLVIQEPFFGLFLMQLYKEFTEEIPTLAVAPHNIGIKLLVNQKFWDSLKNEEQIAVLIHELSHICFNHIFMSNEFADKELFNLAADMEVNSYIKNLPQGSITANLIMESPGKGTKYYYEKLNQMKNGSNNFNNPDTSGSGDHSKWKEFSDMQGATKELVQQQIEHQIKDTATQTEKQHGHIPGQFKEKIAKLFKIKKAVFNWKSYFRNMLGAIIDIKLRKTHRRESLRFEGGADIKYKKKTNILVAIDTSGSVSKEELCDFFSEIHHIYKAGASIRILECDTKIHRNYEYNGKWDLKCSGRGGTILKPCSDYYLEHRREFTKFIIFTDGYFDLSDIQTPVNDNIFIITSQGKKGNYPGKTIYIPKQ